LFIIFQMISIKILFQIKICQVYFIRNKNKMNKKRHKNKENDLIMIILYL